MGGQYLEPTSPSFDDSTRAGFPFPLDIGDSLGRHGLYFVKPGFGFFFCTCSATTRFASAPLDFNSFGLVSFFPDSRFLFFDDSGTIDCCNAAQFPPGLKIGREEAAIACVDLSLFV